MFPLLPAILIELAYALSWNISLDDHLYGYNATRDPRDLVGTLPVHVTGATFTVRPNMAGNGWFYDADGWSTDHAAERTGHLACTLGARMGNPLLAAWDVGAYVSHPSQCLGLHLVPA